MEGSDNMLQIIKFPSTGKPTPVEEGASHIAPMDPIKLPFGEAWVVDFNNPKTLKLVDELSQRSTIAV